MYIERNIHYSVHLFIHVHVYRLSYVEQQQGQDMEDPIDEDIYDLPPEGMEQDWNPPLPPGAPPLPPGAPPPPPGAPPTSDEFIDEDIYDVPPGM